MLIFNIIVVILKIAGTAACNKKKKIKISEILGSVLVQGI